MGKWHGHPSPLILLPLAPWERGLGDEAAP